MILKAGGAGLPVSIQVNSFDQADKIRELRMTMNGDEIEHTDFKVVDLDSKKVLWDYSKATDKQLRSLPAKQQRSLTGTKRRLGK